MSRECYNGRAEHWPRSVEELARLLSEHGVPIERWGMNGAKTIHNLFQEISDGECILTDAHDDLVRIVYVAGVAVFYREKGGKILKLREFRQDVKNGSRRERIHETSLSEKIKRGEREEDAALRGIREDLGIRDAVRITWNSFGIRPTNGTSFPGLKSEAHITTYALELTPWQFRPGGYIERQKDTTTYFGWEEDTRTPTA